MAVDAYNGLFEGCRVHPSPKQQVRLCGLNMKRVCCLCVCVCVCTCVQCTLAVVLMSTSFGVVMGPLLCTDPIRRCGCYSTTGCCCYTTAVNAVLQHVPSFVSRSLDIVLGTVCEANAFSTFYTHWVWVLVCRSVGTCTQYMLAHTFHWQQDQTTCYGLFHRPILFSCMYASACCVLFYIDSSSSDHTHTSFHASCT